MMQLSIVTLAVSDQSRARSFYVDLLGCKVQSEHDTGDGRHWAVLQLPAGSTRIALVHPSERMPAGGTKGLILKTLDVDNARERLLVRGLAIGGVNEASWGRFATFEDPDGNSWLLAESLGAL